jgi:exosortase O
MWLLLPAFALAHRDALAWVAREPAALALSLLGAGLVAHRSRPGPGAWWAPLLAALPPAVAAGLRVVAPLHVVDGVALALSAAGALALGRDRDTLGRLPALVLLLLACLPVQGLADALLGWPLRKALAAVVASALGGLSSAEVIALEGGLAYVDAPCAGLRGLWSGAVVVLLATIGRDAALDRRWAAGAAGGAALFLGANALRVAAVATLHHRLGLPLAAELVHLPLGVVGFLAALAVPVAALRPRAPAPADPSRPPHGVPVAVAAAWLAVAALRPAPAPPAPVAAVPLPAALVPVAPVEAEQAFAAAHGAAITRGRAETATVALVAARSWLAHHVPTWCLTASGWTLGEDRPVAVGGALVRLAPATRDGRRATAVWWFQSAEARTPDLAARVADGLAGGGTWVLVSVLAEGDVAPGDPALAALVDSLRRSVGASLEGS